MQHSSRHVARDGADWRLGTAADLAWITEGTSTDRTIQSSIPLLFDAYATIVIPGDEIERARQDRTIIEFLSEEDPGGRWWLGYLDTGCNDVVLSDAPRAFTYAGWGYVLVEAGPEQATNWRSEDSCWHRRLPDLIFPAERPWLLSTLWDDDWTCIGGPATLVERIVHHPDVEPYARRVNPGEDATPPGHVSI